jgi:hypothetical protein
MRSTEGVRAQIQCACGCGEWISPVDRYDRPRRFVSGHNGRKYAGEDATRWATEKRYRQKNPEKIRETKRNYYRARKLKAMEIMGNRCAHCNIAYNGKNSPIFEFHHLDPSIKEAGVTRLLTNRAWSETLDELKKCVLICANCHNQYHGGEW